jgi:GT2 family glycosyltransferase
MQLSVVILNYNVRYFLETCLVSVQKAIQNIDSEIIVIDNASTDGSCEMIKERFPEVYLIENKENLGFPRGNNIGVEKAKGDYICILNPDTVVAEDTFKKILQFAKNQNELGIIGCKMIDGSGLFLPESKRGVPTPWVAFTKVAGLYKYFPKSTLFNQYYLQHIPQSSTQKVPILTGAFMFLKRQLYQEVGGFDQDCFMYSDDVDLSYLVTKIGFSNYYFADTTIIHYKGESTQKDVLYMKRFQEAMTFFYKKHFNQSFLFTLIMKIGIKLFAFKKMFYLKNIKTPQPESYLIMSENEALEDSITSKLNKNTVIINNIEGLKMLIGMAEKSTTEVIFDTNFISHSDMIQIMQDINHKNITFKIISRLNDYLIGSNTSEVRGEVIILS